MVVREQSCVEELPHRAGERETYTFPSLVLLLFALDADGQVLHHFGVERIELVCDRAIKLASESCGSADLGRVGLADRANQATAAAFNHFVSSQAMEKKVASALLEILLSLVVQLEADIVVVVAAAAVVIVWFPCAPFALVGASRPSLSRRCKLVLCVCLVLAAVEAAVVVLFVSG